MPPITYMQLLRKREQGKDLFSLKNRTVLQGLHDALGDTIRNIRKTGKDRINTRKLEALRDNLFTVINRDPAKLEEYTEEERKQKLWHPERPQRPRQHTNRNSIEDAVCALSEMGDYLGKEVPKEYTNTYDYILQCADEDDAQVIRDGLNLVNDTLELGIPLEKLEKGQTWQPTDEEKKERADYRKAVSEGQANRRENREKFEEQQREAERKRQKASQEADQREKKEIEERSRKQREEEQRKAEEKKRAEDEARKSAEQKKQEEETRRKKARQTQLSNQEAMRMGMTQSILQYRDPDAAPETKKMNMAMAAAYHAELERVGPDGTVPIDADRVKRDIDGFFHSAEFAIAEAEGRLNSLMILEPDQLRQRITQREQEVNASCPEGTAEDRERAKTIWQKFGATWRVAKNSEEFNRARDAMAAYADKKTAPTRADNYMAMETVKRYVAKNIGKAKSDTGKKRMALSLAFLKQTMTKDAFAAYCSALNAQRGFTPTVGENGKPVYDTKDDRYIDPKTVGTVDEVYSETRERLSLVSQGKAELDTRDLAMMTALSALRKKGGGDQAVEKSALEAEIKKVEADPRFREALKNDAPETLINKAWTKQLDALEGYAQPAPQPEAAQQNAPQI